MPGRASCQPVDVNKHRYSPLNYIYKDGELLAPDATKKLSSVLTVSELTAHIRLALEATFDNIAVVGEVSNFKVYPSGHWYFSLKDKEATLSAVCFKNCNQQIKFELEDGMQVVARGKLSVYPPRGSYQIIVTGLEPVGIGAWQLAFEQLRAKLGAEGLLAPERKKPIPILPRRIGIVTSTAGAALRDVLTALNRRNSNIEVVISPCKVQGEGSAEEIAQAIAYLEAIGGIQTILVCRGGGSIEDLWSFNTEIVARAIANCSIPIISGVGHEPDITICDLVADLRAPTPTAAAELVAQGRAELLSRWSNLHRHMVGQFDQRLFAARHQLTRLSPVQSLLRLQHKLANLRLSIHNYQVRMVAKATAKLAQSTHAWEQNRKKLMALSPTSVLARGFAVLRKQDGSVVSQPDDVKPGETLEALLYKGKLKIQVISGEDSW